MIDQNKLEKNLTSITYLYILKTFEKYVIALTEIFLNNQFLILRK